MNADIWRQHGWGAQHTETQKPALMPGSIIGNHSSPPSGILAPQNRWGSAQRNQNHDEVLKISPDGFFAQIDEFTEQMFDIKLALFLIGGNYLNYV